MELLSLTDISPIMVAIVSGVIGVLGGSTVSGVTLWLLNRKRYDAEVLPAEGEGMQQLVERIKGMVKEQLESVQKVAALELELKAQKVLLQVASREKANLDSTIERVLIEQGRAEEREKNCQAELSRVNARLTEIEGLAQVNKRLQKDALVAQGIKDETSKRS